MAAGVSVSSSFMPQPQSLQPQSLQQQQFQLQDVYDIEQVLGEGTYGMVYQARRKHDGLVVALKTMPREYTGQTDFEREVAALQLLSSKQQQQQLSQQFPSTTTTTELDPTNHHIVQLYDLHRDDKNYYLAMELIQGGELLDHLLQNGPYSEAVAALFLRQFAEALCFVHQSGYIHADLKPENLMLATSPSSSSSSSSSLPLPLPSSTLPLSSTVAGDDAAAIAIADNKNNNSHNNNNNNMAVLKVVDFGCACTHDLARKDLQLPAQEFAAGCSFLHQVALGNQFELQRILQERPSLVNFRDYDKRTPLHIAASEGVRVKYAIFVLCCVLFIHGSCRIFCLY